MVVTSLQKHEEDVYACEFGCRALEALASLPANTTSHFNNLDTCQAVAGVFEHQTHNAKVLEHGCRALVEICSHSPNVIKLGSLGVCGYVVTVLKDHIKHPLVCQLACQCIYVLSKERTNQNIFDRNGACDAVVDVMKRHQDVAMVVFQCCKTLVGLGTNHMNMCHQIAANDHCEILTNVLTKHAFSVNVCEWACCVLSLIAAFPRVQENVSSLGTCTVVVQCLVRHKHSDTVVTHAANACRGLGLYEPNVCQLRVAEVIPACLAALDAHAHLLKVVEPCCWILGHIQSLGKGPAADEVLYSHPGHQQLLEACLKIHAVQDKAASNVCVAIGSFVERSGSVNTSACDAMVKLYTALPEGHDFGDAQRILQAIGMLASSHKDNQARLFVLGTAI